jgi:hypothetical protein
VNEMNFSLRDVFVHTSKGFLTCREMLRHGTDCFTSLPKEGVLRIFRPKNPSSSAGFEPANLTYFDKHAKHYTTEDDFTNRGS